MITIVKSVTEVGVKGMNVGKAREVSEHGSEAFGDGLLSELDFAHAVEEWVVVVMEWKR